MNFQEVVEAIHYKKSLKSLKIVAVVVQKKAYLLIFILKVCKHFENKYNAH